MPLSLYRTALLVIAILMIGTRFACCGLSAPNECRWDNLRFDQKALMVSVRIENTSGKEVYYLPDMWRLERFQNGQWQEVHYTGMFRDLQSKVKTIKSGKGIDLVYNLLAFSPSMSSGLYRIHDCYFTSEPRQDIRENGGRSMRMINTQPFSITR